MSHRYFVIFGAMRTGSNLLERGLAAYDGLKVEGELFNPHFIGKPGRRAHLGWTLAARNDDPVGFLQAVIAAAHPRIPGFRLFDGHDARIRAHAAADPAAARILLSRDPLDSFTSLCIARQTGQWMLTRDENRKTARVRFDPEAFERYRDALAGYYSDLRAAMRAQGQSWAEVGYGDLGDRDALNGLAAMIGSAERKDAAPRKILRQNPPALADRVENPDAAAPYRAAAPASPATRSGADALGAMIVSRRYEAIYAPIPGAGARALRRLLDDAAGDAAGATTVGLRPAHLARRRRRGAFVFSFVRHPAARIAALHAHIASGAARYDALRRVLARDYGWRAGRDGMGSFLRFIEDSLAGRANHPAAADWAPQTDLIAAYAAETPLDFVGRWDRADADIGYVLNRIGVAPDLRAGAALPDPPPLTRQEEERLRRLHARDYERLGYDWLSET